MATAQTQAGPPPPPPHFSTPATPPPPPPPPVPAPWSAAGPPPAPPRRKHEGLLPGLVTAAVIVLAGLGVGLYFGLSDRGTPVVAESTTVTGVALTATTATTAPPTTTAATEPPTTVTSAATTTTEQVTSTTNSDVAVLTARVGEWMQLIEAIPDKGDDLLPQLTAFLTPADKAQAKAEDLVQYWSDPGDETGIIAGEKFDKVERITFDDYGAEVLCAFKLECRDGLTTRSYESLGWTLEGGTYKRDAEFDPPIPLREDSTTVFGGSALAGYLLWCPVMMQELKHLTDDGTGPTTAGMFLVVEFHVQNDDSSAVSPGSWQVFAVDPAGKHYSPSKKADAWWPEDVKDRKKQIPAGGDTDLFYTFEVPEGSDLANLNFEVLLPGI